METIYTKTRIGFKKLNYGTSKNNKNRTKKSLKK